MSIRPIASRLAVWFLAWLVGSCLPVAPAHAQPVDEPQFEVTGYEIEGELPIAPERTQAVLAPYTGPSVSLSQLKDAAKALETLLSESGYPFYRVILPAQTAQSVVKLRVLTFKLGNISVRNNAHFSKENVLRSLPALRPGAPTNVAELARNRAAANEHSSKNIEVNFVQSEKADAVDAEVTVQDEKPLRFFAGLNNFGTHETGKYRATLGLQHSNLFDRDHALTATFTTSPDHLDDVRQYGFYYRVPFYDVGGALTFFYAYSDVDSGVIANAFNVSGRGKFAGVQWRQHLVPIGAYAHALEAGLDDRLFENDVLFAGTQLGANVRSRPAMIGYQGKLERVTGAIAGGVQYVHNLGGGDFNSGLAYQANRAGATRNWSAVRASLDGSWRVQPITFVARVRAQHSEDSLIPGEQLGMGGAASVRGLREREVTGDKGVYGSLEGQVPLPWTGLSVVAFFDAGYVRLNGIVTAGVPRDQSAASAGVGLRWAIARSLAASLDAAYVLDGTTVTGEGMVRVHGSVVYWF